MNRQTGEVIQSFAIITSDPPEFIARTGHDRCPVFLNEQNGREWLANAGAPAQELKQFLLAGKSEHEFEVSRHRAMRPGWEKRK